jgi:predicted Zn finger-like uncharacterized protein
VKFLCDNCKAKYQIADEKVAGKTVRMKCRKCGHQIEVRSAVTETSVSSSPPQAPAAPRPAAKGLATSLSAQKPRPQSQAPAGALAGAFQRTVEHAQTAGSLGDAAASMNVSVTDEWYVAINGVPVGPVRISELRRKAGAGAVTEDSLCWQEGLEEWRPVRAVPELAAIVREALQQNRVSLVNPPPEPHRQSSPSRPPAPPARPSQPRGPEPPRAAPEPSRASPEPPRAAPQSPRAAPQSPRAAPQPQRLTPEPPRAAPPEPVRPMAPPQRSNVVPLHARISAPELDSGPATAPLAPPITAPMGGAGAGAALAMGPSPSRAPDVRNAPLPAPPTPAPMAPVADPFAMPPPQPQPSAPMFPLGSSPSLVPPAPAAYMAPPEPRRGVPLWFWPVLLLALGFGSVAAFFVFRPQAPPPPVIVQVPPPPTAPTASTAMNDVPPPPTTAEPEPSASPSATATGGTKVATGPHNGGGTAAQPKGGGAADLTGLLGGNGSGPAVGPGHTGAGAGGGGLDQAGVERVVAQHRIGVRRTCWERGSNDQKSSVNVTVSATVGPNGDVIGTSSNGDDPVVAKCIEGQVRSWKFPAPGSNQQIAIPFKFVRQ